MEQTRFLLRPWGEVVDSVAPLELPKCIDVIAILPLVDVREIHIPRPLQGLVPVRPSYIAVSPMEQTRFLLRQWCEGVHVVAPLELPKCIDVIAILPLVDVREIHIPRPLQRILHVVTILTLGIAHGAHGFPLVCVQRGVPCWPTWMSSTKYKIKMWQNLTYILNVFSNLIPDFKNP